MTNPIDQWLATSTTRSETVTLYADQEAVEELSRAYATLDRAERDPVHKHRAVGEKSVLGELRARIEQLEAKALASRSDWHFRALTREELRECEEQYPDPDVRLDVNPRTLSGEELAEYRKNANLAGEMRTLAKISKAIMSVDFNDGSSATEVSVDTLKRMLDAEYGDARVKMLAKAVTDASSTEMGMPRPK